MTVGNGRAVRSGTDTTTDGAPGAPRTGVGGRHERPERAAILRERWYACSSALGWVSATDWPHPTVDAVCAASTAQYPGTAERDRAVERSLARWAGARAAAGIGLAETLTDLAALSTAASGSADGAGGGPTIQDARAAGRGRGPDGVRLLRAVSLAWTDVACGDIAETSAVDPLSGLASMRYLRTRLAEIYRGARARGVPAGRDHALVLLDLDVADWRRVAPLSIAGDAAGIVFDAGESIAVVGRGTIVVLAGRDGLAERTRVLRRLLTRRLTAVEGIAGPPRVRIVRLPATHDGACALLERLRPAPVGTDTLSAPQQAALRGL